MFKKILAAVVAAAAAAAAGPAPAAGPVPDPPPAAKRPVDVLTEKGRDLMKDKKYEEAAEYFEAVLKLEPRNVAALDDLAWIYNDIEKYDLAVQRCETLLRVEPENTSGWRELGYAQWKTGKYLRAINSLTTALKFNAKDEPSYNYLVAIHLDLKEPQRAKEWLDKRAAQFPDMPVPSWLDEKIKKDIDE